MKWSLKETEFGTIKWEKRFAFFPVKMTYSDEVVWLESYYRKLEYSEYGWERPYAWIVRGVYSELPKGVEL